MGYKILIVDDSAITRAVLAKTIAMTDIPVEEIYHAANGREALDLLASQGVDLVLTDLNMPELNGREMAAKLCESQSTSHIPIIVISTEASSTRIDDLQARGIKNYIHKPFTAEEIRNVLLDVLQPCGT